MKHLITFILILSMSSGIFAIHTVNKNGNAKSVEIQTVDSEAAMSLLTMTPRKYKELTGKKMNFKQRLKLKIAKKILKKKAKSAGSSISKGLYIVLAIIGLGWLAMGINDDFSGDDWLISLVLSLLFWLPGVIYSLIKMKKYY